MCQAWMDSVMQFLEAIWFSWQSLPNTNLHISHILTKGLIAAFMIWSLPWDHFSPWEYFDGWRDLEMWEIVIFQPSKSWLFLYFFWSLLINGTVISLVPLSFGTLPYAAKKKQIGISNVLCKFVWYVLYLLTEHGDCFAILFLSK